MASGWNLWVWLVSVVVRRYYYRYPHNNAQVKVQGGVGPNIDRRIRRYYYRYPHNNYYFPLLHLY